MNLTVFSDEYFMKEALKEAQNALETNEIPVGAIITVNNQIIARAYNQTEKLNDVTAHAEMLAFTAASNSIGGKYLKDCTLYVTLEPCNMCAGAAFWTQIGRIVFGASDKKRGFRVFSNSIIHPKTKLFGGVMEHECETILKEFFKNMR
ncbi:MAG: nucleoside deaminase [Bacteroidales bacterium]|nr:nucleoside deaminase [Bacteroidales bacterium]